MRLFTAIETPASMQQALAQLCFGLPRVRWMPPEQLHLTLVFIGEVQPGLLQPIIDQLAAIRFERFRLTCQGLGSFRSGVLWLGVEPVPELITLQRTIEHRLRRIDGLTLQSRRYQPHLTLARLPRRNCPDLSHFIAAHQGQRFSYDVTAFTLKSSQLLTDGARHRCEAEFPCSSSEPSC